MSDSIILTCTSCHAKNRVPVDRLQDGPVCGRCKTPFPKDSLGEVTDVSDKDFNTMVIGSALPVLVDCWAPWCGPCRAVAPILEGLAPKYAGRVRFFKMNLDENPATGARYGITSVPTLLLVKNGQINETLVGAQPKEVMEAALARLI